MATQALRDDPITNFSFEIYTQDGTIPPKAVGFSEVSGLKSNTGVVPYRNGNEQYTRKLLGKEEVGNITLRKGLDKKGYLRMWYESVREISGRTDANGNPTPDPRKVLIIEAKSRPGDRTVRRWVGYAAWPCSYELSDLRGDAEEAMIESCEVCLEILEEDKAFIAISAPL